MANRKKRRNFIIVGIVLIISIALFLIIRSGTLFSFGGFSALSISDVEIVGDGERIRIYGVANGAEQLSINWNPSQINQYIQNEGYQATQSVTGSIRLTEASREFPISRDNSRNYYEFFYRDIGLFSNCDNNAQSGEISMGRLATSTCGYARSIGTDASFTGQAIDNTEVTIEIDGRSGTLNPSSGQNTLSLNNGNTEVRWVGNLVNYNQIFTPQYHAMFSNSQYTKLINENSYQQQENDFEDFAACVGSFGININQISEVGGVINSFRTNSKSRDCIRDFNNDLNSVLQDRTSNYENSINAQGVELTSNSLIVEAGAANVFPTFTITLDAESVGIIKLSGEPDIVSCVEDRDISSGETYNTNVRVRNVGQQDGQFSGTVECSGSSGVSGIVSQRYIGAGSTSNLPVQLSGENVNSGTQNNNCKITITDENSDNSDNSDSCNFNVGVEYKENQICEPDAITCLDSNTRKICNSDGTGYDTQTCQYDCIVLDSGEGVCSQDDNDDGSGQQLQCRGFESLKQTTGCGFLGAKCWFGGSPQTVTKCVVATWVWLAGGIVIVGLIVLILIGKKKITGKLR